MHRIRRSFLLRGQLEAGGHKRNARTRPNNPSVRSTLSAAPSARWGAEVPPCSRRCTGPTVEHCAPAAPPCPKRITCAQEPENSPMKPRLALGTRDALT
jgi:hypothetical protein